MKGASWLEKRTGITSPAMAAWFDHVGNCDACRGSYHLPQLNCVSGQILWQAAVDALKEIRAAHAASEV